MFTKRQKIIYTFICLSLLVIGFILGDISNDYYEKKVEDKTEDCNIKKDNTEKEKIIKQLYYTENGRNIYLYGIDRVTYNKQSLTIQDNIFDIINKLENTYTLLEEYDDGGSKLYQTDKQSEKVDFKLNMLVCNTLDGNKDVYFGDTNMTYNNNFCKSSSNETFTKTYHVLKILESDTDEANYLVLRAFQRFDDVYIAKIGKYLLPEILENDPCEFTFRYTDSLINERNIESIFENSELVKVEKTDKLGLEQRNDSIKQEYLED